MKLFRYSMYILGMLFICLTLLFGFLCVQVYRQGSVDLAQPADSIIVLGAWVLPDGRPSEDLFVRTEHAVELYHKGIANSIICTGGFAGDPSSAASVARSIALAYGVPPQNILLADGSMTTQEDAREAARVMKSQGWNTAVLVSHPFHLYRCRLFFEREGLTVYTSPTNTHLDTIKPEWRVTYVVREALFIVWASVETLGLPRPVGYLIQNKLYQLSKWLVPTWAQDIDMS